MTHREDIQRVLAAWRAADRALAEAVDGERPALEADIERTRAEYHRVSSAFMTEHMDKLREAEGRRAALTPSTPAYHRAARDTVEIAADIWETGRQSDRDIPGGSRAESKV